MDIQKICEDLLLKVKYPRVGTIIGLQEELGRLAETIMDIEIYGKPIDKEKIDKRCAEVFFSFIDLCNSYGVNLEKVSQKRIEDIKNQIENWEKAHGEILRAKKEKFD